MTQYLYRKTKQAAMLTVAMTWICLAMQAQYRTLLVPPPERKTPRALAVLETYKNGSRRLIPVTFFYEKHYYDAGLYHATPVPFTLYSETVYEIEQFGKPLGTFTVRSASRIANDEWFGNGSFKPAVDQSALAKKRPAPVVLQDPSKPVLHRREGSQGDNPSAHPTETASQSPAEDDLDRPKLHRREDSGSGTADQARTASGAGNSPAAAGNATPPAVASKSGAGVGAAAAQLTPSDDTDHPFLRRGKPVEEQSGADLPEFKKEQGGRDLPAFNQEQPVAQQVAVSDAGPSSTTEGQELIYVCREPERRQLEAGARELAKSELRRLAAQRNLVLPGAAKTSASAARKRAAASKPPELTLDNEQFVPYDLDYNNYATVVYSARYTPPPASGSGSNAAASAAKSRSWVVTVIAREDSDLKLNKLYSAVSDPRALDLYPEVKLVDAVDPDGYGRHALLFREQKRDGVSWLLGRPTGYELEALFETAVR